MFMALGGDSNYDFERSGRRDNNNEKLEGI